MRTFLVQEPHPFGDADIYCTEKSILEYVNSIRHDSILSDEEKIDEFCVIHWASEVTPKCDLCDTIQDDYKDMYHFSGALKNENI